MTLRGLPVLACSEAVRCYLSPAAVPELGSMVPAEGDGLPVWLHLVPFGAWRGHPIGPFEVGPREAQQILDNHEARGIDLAIDYEHQTLNAEGNGQPAPAAGWIDRLEVRESGVWGHVREWTERAAAHLRAREYRYLSPVLLPRSIDRVTGRPTGMKLLPVALTNMPFFASDLSPVLNRGQAGPSVTPTEEPLVPPFFIPLLALVGLTAESTEAEVVAARDSLERDLALRDTVKTELGWEEAVPADAPEKLAASLRHEGFVPFSEHVEKLQAAQAETETIDDKALLARAVAEGKVTASMKPVYEAQLAKGGGHREAALEVLRKASPVVPLRSPVSRSTGKSSAGGSELTDAERLVAAQTGVDSKVLAARLRPSS